MRAEASLRPPSSATTSVALALVLSACPDISDFAKDEIRSLRDLCVTADLVRRVMGVTQDGWDEARRVMFFFDGGEQLGRGFGVIVAARGKGRSAAVARLRLVGALLGGAV